MLVALVAGVVILVLTRSGDLAEHAIAAAGAGGFLLLAALARPGGMGMGDVKLAGVMGLYLGRAVIPALFVALIAGSVLGAIIIARKGAKEGRKTAVPFGPFLALGGLAGLFAGDAIATGTSTPSSRRSQTSGTPMRPGTSMVAHLLGLRPDASGQPPSGAGRGGLKARGAVADQDAEMKAVNLLPHDLRTADRKGAGRGAGAAARGCRRLRRPRCARARRARRGRHRPGGQLRQGEPARAGDREGRSAGRAADPDRPPALRHLPAARHEARPDRPRPRRGPLRLGAGAPRPRARRPVRRDARGHLRHRDLGHERARRQLEPAALRDPGARDRGSAAAQATSSASPA